jgi:multidrug efflux pump subunit AcrB
LQIGGRQSNAQFQYTLSGENLDELYEWAPKLTAQLRKIPQLKDVNSDQQISGLEANVVIDRDTRRGWASRRSKSMPCSTTLLDRSRSRPSTRR